MEIKELLPQGSAVVHTTQRQFSVEVDLARQLDQEDVIDEIKGEPAYVFSNNRKFYRPSGG